MATVKTNRLSLFVSSPGKARATIPGHGANGAGIKRPQPRADFGEDFPNAEENPTTFQARKSKISRYCSNSSNKNSKFKPNRSETGSTCSHFYFQSFKSRFCSGGKSSVISRPLRAFSAKLASNYKRPYNFRDDTGLQTRVYLNSRPKQTTPTIFLFRNGKDRPRNLRALGKRSAACGQTGFRSVYKQFVFGTETGREISPCDQSKGPEHIPSVRSFQNGGYPPSSRFTPASRLAGKDRPEGCVLRDSYLEESPEVPLVSLERHTSRVCVPSLWPGGCSEAFHEGYEAGCCSSSARRYPSDHLLGRSAVHESIAGGPGTGYGNCALLARESRVCCQFRQVMFRSNPAVGISRVSSQQSGYGSAPSRLQSGGNKSPLSWPASTSRRICPGVVSAHRETDGIHTGHISGSLALPISSAPETPSSNSAKRVRCNNSSVKRSQGRASLVVSLPRCMEWSCASSPSSRSRDRDRCFEEGLGGSMPGCENRGGYGPRWSAHCTSISWNC